MKRVRDEKAESSAVINVILASENVKLAESITWTKPKAAKKQKTDEEETTNKRQSGDSCSVSSGESLAIVLPTLTVLVTDEQAMEVIPRTNAASASTTITGTTTPSASPSKVSPLVAVDVVHSTRAALESWAATYPSSTHATGSFAQSTPSRLRRTASPAYIDALHVLGPLLAQQQYGAALTQLNTVAILFPCHRTQAEYYVLRAFTVEKLQRSDEEVCSVYSAAIESAAQPASGVLEGFQSFERRRSERLGQPTDAASTAAVRAGVNVPATPMSRLLHKYKSVRPSPAATLAAGVGQSAAVAVPPATPRSAVLRSRLLNDNEHEDGASAAVAPTPRSAQLRTLKLTPDSDHVPPPSQNTVIPAQQQQLEPQQPQQETEQPIEPSRVDTPRSQPTETDTAAEQTTPQLARNLLDDMQAADEIATPPMPRAPADVLSPLTPLLLSIGSPTPVKDGVQTVVAEEADAPESSEANEDSVDDDTDTSLASPEAPAGLFDEDEYIPGLSTPFPCFTHIQPSLAVDPPTSCRPAASVSTSQPTTQPPPAPSSVVVMASIRASPSVSRALGSEYFVSPVRRSTRHMAVGAVPQSEAQLSSVEKHKLLENAQYAYLPNNALQPPRSSSRARHAAKLRAEASNDSKQQPDSSDTAMPVLAITVDTVPAAAEEAEAVIKPVPRKGTPMHVRRPNASAVLPPPPIARPNLIVLQPVRSPHTATATATSSSASASSATPSIASSLMSPSAAFFVSPVRRSARHSVDWTDAAHETLVRLEAGKVSLKPNASLGDREQEWKQQAERDRAAMPPPPPRMPRGGKRATTTAASSQQLQQQPAAEGGTVAVPAPAGRFEGGKRHATPRPSGTRRSSRLVAQVEEEEAVSEEAAEVERAVHARNTRRRSQRFE